MTTCPDPSAPDRAPRREEHRRGDWLQTFSGRQFWPMDPRPEEIEVEDIAHALSMACRYAGHCLRFYSVAEHSVLLSRAVAPEHRLWALLHDASEAYLVDVPRPVKPFLANYREAEDALMAAVCRRFGLPLEMPAEVKRADSAILNDERAQNMRHCRHEWGIDPTPLGVTLKFWSPYQAETEWLNAFDELEAQGLNAFALSRQDLRAMTTRPDPSAPDRAPPREEGYAYIRRMYGLDYRVGMRVRLENSALVGTVARMKPSAGHHVQVRFDGEAWDSPCHPNSLAIEQEPRR